MPETPEGETDPRTEQALRLGDLREEVMDRIDASEYGTADDPDGTEIWLRYYADEQTRRDWDGPVPPKESLSYDRDRCLPQPE